MESAVRACWHSLRGVMCCVHNLIWQLRLLHLFSAPLYEWVHVEFYQAAWQTWRQWASVATAFMSVVSMFFTDVSGLRPGPGPRKGTLMNGPSRCGLVPSGGGPMLPLLLLPP